VGVVLTKTELIDEVLTLPAGGIAREELAAPRAGRAPTAAAIEAMLRDARAELHRVAAAGMASRAAALSLEPSDTEDILPSIAATLAARVQTEELGGAEGLAVGVALAPLLYDQAVEAAAAGRIADAVALLSALLAWPSSEADGLLGLAVCAARLERYDTALVLATERLRLGAGHPRACCIAGLCELERGDRRAAQNYLAAAARLARRQPQYRDDLRAAQRLLIMMHFD
jgi:hypothetical protein